MTVADPHRAPQFLYLLTSRGYQTHADQAGEIGHTTQGVFVAADVVMIAAFCLGVAAALRRAIRGAGAERSVHLLLLAWIASPVLLPSPAPRIGGFQQIHPLYFLVTFPGALVLAALGLDQLGRFAGRFRHHLRATGPLAVAGVASLHVVAAGLFFAVQREYWPLADYALPLRQTVALADLARAHAGPSPILVTGHQEIAGVLYRVLQRRGVDVRYVEDRGVMPLLERGQAVYVTTDDDAWAARHLRTWLPSAEEAAFVAPGSGWTARLFRVDAGTLAGTLDAGDSLGASGDLAPLAVVESASVPAELSPGTLSEVRVRWRFLSQPDDACLAQLAVLDGAGRAVFSREEVVYPVDIWRPGDYCTLLGVSLYQRFSVQMPEAAPPGEHTVMMQLVSVIGRRPLSEPVRLASVAVGEHP